MRGKLVTAIGAGLLAACGTLLGVTTDDTPLPTPGPQEAGVGADTGSDAPTLDAGSDAPLDGGDDADLPPAEAGSVACGDQACEAIQLFCCYDGGVPSCTMDVVTPCAFELACDQPGDCISAEPCVLLASAMAVGCAPSVPDDAGSLCGDEGDCPSGRCVVTTCRGIRMRLCDGYCPP